MAQHGSDQPVIRARFLIQIPRYAWISEISRSFPEATFRLLTGLRIESGAIEIGEVRAENAAAVSESIESHRSIRSYQLLDATDTRRISRYETSESDLYEFVEQSSLAPEYPITVRNGWFEYDLTGTREEFDRFRVGLEESGLGFELVSTVQFAESAMLLTDRQRQAIETALRMGYFDVPRSCTLENVADRLNIDKSTASEIIRRGEGRVLRGYLTGPTGT